MHKKIISEIRNILGSENIDDKLMYDKIFKIVNDTVGLEVLGAPDAKNPPTGEEYMDKEKSNIAVNSIISNASDWPTTVYIRHMENGIASYPSKKMTLLINNEALLKMKNSLVNKPIYIEHKNLKEDTPENMENNMHGVIVENFLNPLDSWFWAKAVIFTDEAKSLIKKGWLVSNSYRATELSNTGGMYHNIPYDLEVKNGVYDHIALVERPRYEGVMILTPEEYKKYNQQLEIKLQNSIPNNDKKRSYGMFNLFKKAKIEEANDADIFAQVDDKLVPISELKLSFKNSEEKKKEEIIEKKICNAEEIDVDGKKVSMKELINCYKAEQVEKAEKKKLENEEEGKKKEEEKVAEEKEKEKIKNSLEGNEHFDKIQNKIEEAKNAKAPSERKYETLKEKLERGKKY